MTRLAKLKRSAITAIDVSALKDGDRAGLLLLQKKFGWVGVKVQQVTREIAEAMGQS